MKRLDKTMVEYVLSLDNDIRKNIITPYSFTMEATDYALFLSQPIKLEMFVPCKDGKPLKEPKAEMCCNASLINGGCGCLGKPINEDWWVYQKAKEKVIFDGWSLYVNSKKETIWLRNQDKINLVFICDSIIINVREIKTIEDLIPYKLKLIKEL